MDEARQDELRFRLEEAMSLHGLSQTAVARETDVTQPTISRFLNGGGLGEDSAEKILRWIEGADEAPVPTSSEVRRAIRLYRYMQNLTDNGTTIYLRHPDGTEQALLILM